MSIDFKEIITYWEFLYFYKIFMSKKKTPSDGGVLSRLHFL